MNGGLTQQGALRAVDTAIARIAELTEAVADARRFAATVEAQNAAALAIVDRMVGLHFSYCRNFYCNAPADLAAVRDALGGDSA